MMRAAAILCLACLAPATLAAQTARDATVLVTVVDETRGVLPGATVTIAGADAASKEAIAPATASVQGQVTFENLVPGRYSITAEFSGFQTRTLTDVRLRSGNNKQLVVLPIDRLQSSVTVERDRQQVASERDITFGTVMTREQIDALSDDPDELRRQLMDIAGPDARILIDSFEGRDLPPKALIKSIRVTRDSFAPEVHFAGEVRIEILTQPGIGPIRGNMRMGFYDSALDGENPLVNQTGPAQSWMYGIGLNGTLLSERASFNINFNGQDSYATPVLYAQTPVGQIAGNIPLRALQDNYFYNGGVDYALTRDQVLRLNFQGSQFSRGNIGVGAQDLPERAYTMEDTSYGVFLQQNGPIGRRFVLNTRLSLFGNNSTSRSAIEEPTIIVNDEFTNGGAQRSGGQHTRNYFFNSDLDYVRGRHSMRFGVEVQASTYRSDANSNYLGTYVFESLEAFNEGRARSYSRRIGDPNISYSNVQGGIYAQDDFKIRKNLTVTGGVRYEAQTHIPDQLNFAPRVGFTWAPFKSGRTTLRGSWGMFYDWLPTGTYAQTLQIDGFRLREVNLDDPAYPDPGNVGSAPPTNRYLLGDNRDMAYSQRLSAGFAQTISRRVTTNVLYSYSYRYALLTGRNLNTPDQRYPAGSRFRQRRAGDVRRPRPAARGERLGQHQPRAVAANRRPRPRRAGRPGDDRRGRRRPGHDDDGGRPRPGGRHRPALRVEPRPVALRLLQLRPDLRQHRRRVRHPGEHLPPQRMGPGGVRSPAERPLRDHQHRPAQLQRPHRRHRPVGAAADDPYRHRRQRRPRLQRSARRRRPQLGADHGLVEHDRQSRLLVHARQEDGDFGRRRPDHGLAGRPDRESDRDADAAALSPEPLDDDPEPAEPAGVFRLQRHRDVDILPEADAGDRAPPPHVQHERQLLDPEGLCPSDSPARSLARRFDGALRSRGSLAAARSRVHGMASTGRRGRRVVAPRDVIEGQRPAWRARTAVTPGTRASCAGGRAADRARTR